MKKLYLIILTVFLYAGAFAQQIAPFKAGDRVVFTGNSITDGGRYHSFIWLYYITRFPGMRIDCFNAGIGGDVAGQMNERLDEDVFARKPTVVTLGFGMNDTGYQFLEGDKADSNYRAKINTAKNSFESIQQKLNAHPDVRKIMLGSSPYDGDAEIKAHPIQGKNEAIQKVIALQKDAAKKYKWDFFSFNEPMQAINRKQQVSNPGFTMQGFDRIHPTIDGHMVMAYLFLKAQGFAGKKVAELAINASAGKTTLAENCRVTNLKANNKSVSFTYLANALPYPLDTVSKGGRSQADAQKLVPFIKEFNQEVLQVAGLQKGKSYIIKIDSTKIGTWPAAELEKGVNMATITATPQYQQALAIMHLNEERWAIERRLREYWWLHYSILKPKGLLYNDSEATVDSVKKYAQKDFFVGAVLNTYYQARLKPVRDAWQKEIELLTNELYLINQPKAHKVSIEIDEH
ncbi:SGNH/GDSL hydrolase family protein [Mucilaginibacter sp. JRF]|uniref:SGNH/GDSL hydrolase family protein n=1 Tax=Mucilaginibacter sp. JRF TaxID=2780088 RepID=UPI00187F7779|nr:SGNH/GDSL hydrolase family protein [Mucilaginibacter sp. JRF]MBE9585805.1 SGNH/GDSL hydrolase family protein [Mucilaginibacter sp. JRF]